MFVTVHPVRMALEGVHPLYNARNVRLSPVANGCEMVDLVWKADTRAASGNPDMRDRFFVYGTPNDEWSWLKPELYHRVEHLRKSAAYRY